MNWRALVISVFLTHFLAQAQIPSSIKPQPASSRSNPQLHALEIQKLADQTATLPSELRADALIRIAEAKSETESIKQKKRLLSEAFEAAMRAKYDALPIGLANRSASSVIGALEASVGQGLDRLSLQSRVVSAMAAIDGKQAEELLREIVIRPPNALTCDDLVDSRVTLFYESAAEVLKNEDSTPLKQRALAEWIVGTVRNPREFEPALRAVRAAPLLDAVKSQLYSDIAVRMGAMKIDDPRTASEVLDFGLSQAVFDALESEKEIDAQTLLVTSYRHFIATNVGSVCSDDGEFAERVKMIWQRLGEESERLGVATDAALKLDINPEVLETNARAYLLWQQNGSKEMLDGYRRLAETKEREKTEWEVQLQLFLDQFRHWQQETHEPDAVRFNETCTMYEGLLDIVSSGGTADQIRTEYVSYLQSSSVLFDDPPLWDLQVVRLIHQCCSHPQGGGATRTPDIRRYVTPQSAIGVIASLTAALAPPASVAAKPK
jgi:hypothetical protein